MRTQQIDCFIEVASTHSFSRAAENLYLSVSMVSYYISSLEKEVGFGLFRRNKHTVNLTPAGEVFYQDMLHAMKWLDHSIQKARKVDLQYSNILNLGWMTTVSISLSSLMAEWQKYYPHIQLIPHPFPYTVAELQDNKLDIGVFERSDIKDYPDIGFLPLAQSMGSILVNQNNPLAKKPFYEVHDLLGEVIAFPEKINQIKGLSKIHHDIQAQCPSINIRYIPDFFSAGISLVKANVCVMVVLDISINIDPDIVTIPLHPIHSIEIGIAWRIAEHNEKAKNCIELIRKVFQLPEPVTGWISQD